MRIIKNGNLKPRYFTCDKCGCEFVADMSEYSLGTANNTKLFYTQCPECHAPVQKDEFSAPLEKENN